MRSNYVPLCYKEHEKKDDDFVFVLVPIGDRDNFESTYRLTRDDVWALVIQAMSALQREEEEQDRRKGSEDGYTVE